MRRPIRVLFAGHTYMVAVNQAKLDAIARTGAAQVALLAPTRWPAAEFRRSFELEKTSLPIRYYPASVLWAGRSGAYLYPPWAIEHALRDFAPDLIQVEQEAFSLSAFQLAIHAARHNRPLVVLCAESVDKPLWALRRWTRSIVLRTASLIIAVNADARDLVRSWGYKGEVAVMPLLGVDEKLFCPRSRAPNARIVIGFVGRLVPEKGVDTLLDAARMLRDEGLDFSVEICGAGPDAVKLRHKADRLGLGDRVTWHDFVPHENVPDMLARMDALVLPSRSTPHVREQFGHVLIEAMAMRLPVIGSDCGEIPNVIGRADAIFPEQSAAALAGRLRRLIADPKWHSELAEHGFERVRTLFTHSRIAKRLMLLWQDLLRRTSETAA